MFETGNKTETTESYVASPDSGVQIPIPFQKTKSDLQYDPNRKLLNI